MMNTGLRSMQLCLGCLATGIPSNMAHLSNDDALGLASRVLEHRVTELLACDVITILAAERPRIWAIATKGVEIESDAQRVEIRLR